VLDAQDADHRRAAAIAHQLAHEKRPSFITNYIDVETHGLLLRRLGRIVAREWLFSRALPIVRVQLEEEERAREILARYTDKDWTLCDAISFAVIETRSVRQAFTFDRHFQQYGRVEVLGLTTS
jgi:predicted nucleic acid-binding protein